jgi:hypothetical protein
MNATATSTESTKDSGQLGTIVTWRVPSSVGLTQLRESLQKTGLGETLAADMHPRHALSRALREMKEGRVIRTLRREGDLLYFQFTTEHFDAAEITYTKEAELTLNLETSCIECTVPEIAEHARKLLAEHLNKRLTSDLTRLVQRVYEAKRADLIPIREQGGAYFVPDMHRELVNQTRQLLDDIGGKLRTFDVRLGSADTSASVADSLSEYLTDLIREFRSSCENVNNETGKKSVEHRHEKIAELRRKLECYGGLLSTYSATINSQIEAAEKELMEKLLQSPTPEAEEITETAAEPEAAVA